MFGERGEAYSTYPSTKEFDEHQWQARSAEQWFGDRLP
jgi:hypothetical protein